MKFFQKILCSLAALFFLVSPVFAEIDRTMAMENGIFENTQVVFLLLSGISFAVLSFKVSRNIRYIFWAGTWFCLSCILRELDVEDLAVPQWVILMGSGMGRNLLMASGWVVIGVITLKSYPEQKGLFRQIIRSPMGRLAIAAGTVLLMGAVFDRTSLMAKQGKIWEEGFETVGYFLLLLASFYSPSITDE